MVFLEKAQSSVCEKKASVLLRDRAGNARRCCADGLRASVALRALGDVLTL